ncbi:MAG: hypothetical protein AAF401_05785 [Pseudomonadota bacterium]
MEAAAAQSELQCDSCGGQRVYAPAHQGLECVQCGQTTRIVEPEGHDAADERDYVPGEDKPVELKTQAHHCQTCGGDVVFIGPALSERCAYCDGAVVLRPSDEGYETMALIPFRLPQDAAVDKAFEWVSRRLAAPDDLMDAVAGGRFAGLYAPFWTFDSHEAISYWATYKKKSGKRTVTRSTSGRMETRFNDMLVPASPHVTPLIRDGILHEFDPRRLKPYMPEFLAGFGAERHHQSVTEGLRSSDSDKDLLIRNRIKRHVGERGVTVTRYRTDTTGIRYRRILLPVWMLHYEYQGEPMKVVVCGMQGRTFGERPFSTRKLIAYSALFTGIAMAVGLIWGAVAAG